jgi:lysophospholipid acyltransferase (LPLAT)-like uncharacterized protein
MVPKPFARIAVAIGEPYALPPGTPLNELETHRLLVQEAVMSLMTDCESLLNGEQEAGV